MAVAVQTPAHAQRLFVDDDRHLVDLAMTAHAADAAVDVLGVIEERVVGQPMHALPFDGNALLVALAHLGKERAGWLDGLVTVHVRLRVGDGGMRRALDVRMAVDARHAQLAGMQLMRERHWLLRRIADPREFGPQRQPGSGAKQPNSQHAPAEYLPEQSVGSWLKDHRGLTRTASRVSGSLFARSFARAARCSAS